MFKGVSNAQPHPFHSSSSSSSETSPSSSSSTRPGPADAVAVVLCNAGSTGASADLPAGAWGLARHATVNRALSGRWKLKLPHNHSLRVQIQ